MTSSSQLTDWCVAVKLPSVGSRQVSTVVAKAINVSRFDPGFDPRVESGATDEDEECVRVGDAQQRHNDDTKE